MANYSNYRGRHRMIRKYVTFKLDEETYGINVSAGCQEEIARYTEIAPDTRRA